MRSRLAVVAAAILGMLATVAVGACRDEVRTVGSNRADRTDRAELSSRADGADSPDAASFERLPAEVVQSALRSVVLVVTERGDQIGYGSGFLVGDEHLVLTNHHVVDGADHVQVMPWREGRLSYTPMDGGLKRYLFENQRELLDAEVTRNDRSLDLAVLEIDGDLSGLPPLTLSHTTLRPGDRVYALGHPGETVWSFTAGVVSALHRAAIQHDAAVNGGSSGGPLIDRKGRVVGVNTAKLLAGAEGVAFARPAVMAQRLLDQAEGGGYVIDFADLRAAVLGCFHAQEMGASTLRRCFDLDLKWKAFLQVMGDLGREFELPQDLLARLIQEEKRADWLEHEANLDQQEHELQTKADLEALKKRRMCEAAARLEPLRPYLDPSRVGRALARAQEAADAEMEKVRRWRLEEAGFQPDLDVQGPIQQTIKMGIRIEEVRRLAADRAWVLLAGRNLDDSPYRLSEHWVRKNGRWYQQLTPTDTSLADLPEGWPPPLGDWNMLLAGARAGILEAMDHLVAGHTPVACSPGTTAAASG